VHGTSSFGAGRAHPASADLIIWLSIARSMVPAQT
jgi:hypothetical protein